MGRFAIIFVFLLLLRGAFGLGYDRTTTMLRPACTGAWEQVQKPHVDPELEVLTGSRASSLKHGDTTPDLNALPKPPPSITTAEEARAAGYHRGHLEHWLPEPNIQHIKDLGYTMLEERFSSGLEGRVSSALEPETHQPVILKESYDGDALETEADTFHRLNEREDIFTKKTPDPKDPENWAPEEIRKRRFFARAKLVHLEKAPDQPVLSLELFADTPGSTKRAPTLEERLSDPNDPVMKDPKKRTQLVMELMLATQRMHRARIIHRDLKPANILVNSEGHLQIIDFGFSEMDGTHYYGYYEDDGTPRISGTPYYMGEAQRDGKRATETQDAYAVRKILIEIIAGGRPKEFLSKRFFAPGLSPEQFKQAVEGSDIDPRVAAALWCPEGKTDGILIRNLSSALNLPPEEFYPSFARDLLTYGRKRNYLPHTVADAAAETIGGSRDLIERFPRDYSKNERDAIIRSMLEMSLEAKPLRNNGRLPLEGKGDRANLLYAEFFQKVKALQQAGQAEPMTVYAKQVQENRKVEAGD